jgi:hypothetical protein
MDHFRKNNRRRAELINSFQTGVVLGLILFTLNEFILPFVLEEFVFSVKTLAKGVLIWFSLGISLSFLMEKIFNYLSEKEYL